MMNADTPPSTSAAQALAMLEQSVYTALENYSNVHRGSGHASLVSTRLYEKAREIMRVHFGKKYTIIFCTPSGSRLLCSKLKPGTFRVLSSADMGLRLGVRVVAAESRHLPGTFQFRSGGGTSRLMARNWVIWEDTPERFEPGTPPLINIIAFTQALQLEKKFGKDVFRDILSLSGERPEILYNENIRGLKGKELLDHIRETMIGAGNPVPVSTGEKPYIHLDNSASTPAPEAVWKVFRDTLLQKEKVQNELIGEARKIVSDFVDAPLTEYELLFTSNTTEGVNLVAESFSYTSGKDVVIMNTIAEHSSNDLPWRMIPGAKLIHSELNEEGFPDLVHMEKLLREYNADQRYGNERIRIIAVSGASNVLGLCNNIAEISRLAHSYGAKILVDAAQLVAHRKISMKAMDADILVFSGHKIYAPFGAGVLFARKGTLGFDAEEMEKIRAEGEENATGIAALGKALLLMKAIGLDVIEEHEKNLTQKLIEELKTINGLRLRGYNQQQPSFPENKLGVVVFDIRGKMPKAIATQLSHRQGIGVRYGCHCAHIIVKHILGISPGLEKFQKIIQLTFPKLKLQGVVRVSLGLGNRERDIDALAEVLKRIPEGKMGGVPDTIPPKELKRKIENYISLIEEQVFAL